MPYAKTRIDAGKDKDGRARTFEVGQEVTGLSQEELKQLQDAGSLSDQAPREGEPGYQSPENSDAAQQQREREQALRDAAASGGTSGNVPRNTQDARAREQAQRGATSTSDATRRELTSQSSGADASGTPNAGTQTTTGQAGDTTTTTRRR